MTDDDRNSEPAASTEGEPDYEVGYCRPPKHGQIKPGEVRNKRGKARGTRSLKNDVREILNMPVPLNDPGRKRKVTTRKAALLKLREKALKGDSRSLDRLLEYPVVPYLPVGDKETRMRLQAARVEAGLVFLPREGAWLADFEEEVRQFPGGKHNDQVDSMSQMLDHMSARRTGQLFIGTYRF